MTAALATVALLSGAATSSTSTSYTYIPFNGHVIGPDEVAAVVADETGIRTAPTGDVTFTPLRDYFRMRLDDLSPAPAPVHVTVSQRHRIQHLCVPLGRTVTIRRIDPGRTVTVHVWDGYLYRNGCEGTPLGGTLTIMR